jgi:hypothetical protein
MSKKLKQTVCAIAWKDKDGNTQLTFHAGREKTVEEIQTHAMNTIPEKYKDREFMTIQEIPETFLIGIKPKQRW